MEEEMDQEWRALSEEILSGMKEWRVAHPKATFREIEIAAGELASRLQARLVQNSALASEVGNWAKQPREERPKCPNCAVPLQPRGTHKRQLQGQGGKDVTLTRGYGTCPTCGMGFFPPG